VSGKKRWWASNAESLEEVAASIQRSSKNGHNVPQLVDEPTRPIIIHKVLEGVYWWFL